MFLKGWIKLYMDILFSEKMGEMDDHLWRRCIELFLCAGMIGEKGKLDSPDRLAYLIHTDVPDVEACLKELSEAGTIVYGNDGTAYIKNFEKYQGRKTVKSEK